MSYVPDKAYDDIKEVGQKAFLLYTFYCKHGSIKNNRTTASLKRAAKFLGIVYENVCRLNAILKKKKWIEIDGAETVLLKGWTDENNSRNSATSEYGTNAVPPELIKTTVKTDKNNSPNESELTKATVLTDENNSLAKTKVEQTDKNVSLKLIKTSVAYKEEPAPFNQQEEKKDSNESYVRLFENDAEIRDAIRQKIGLKPRVEPLTASEWNSVAEVFAFWKQTFAKNSNARLTNERGRAVLDRLRSIQKFTVAEIQSAILGCRASPNHNGTKGAVYDDLELICRTDGQLVKMMGYYEASEKMQNGRTQINSGNDAGSRNAKRVSNTAAVINELRRQGEQEQALSRGRDGDGEENDQLGEPAAAF